MAITIKTVQALEPGQVIWDSGREAVKGFGCRRQRRAPTYILKYRAAARQRFITIGPHGSPWTPDTARREARRLLGLVAAGRDPGPAAKDAFEEIARDYLARAKGKLKARSYDQVQRHLTKHWAIFNGASIYEITRRQVASHVAALATSSGPVAAARARSALSALFNWAIREGYELPANPVAGSNRPTEPPSRARVLSDAELAAIWRACGDDDFGRIIRLLALTGQRREEVGGMQWAEIDAGAGLWNIGAGRTKNRRPHSLPLSRQALGHLPPPNGREWVFGIGPTRGFSGWSAAKLALDARAGLAVPWRIHDLRRSCATGMANLGTLPHVIEAVLNHVSGSRASVAGIYNRATYAKEMREALELWAEHIKTITCP
jgi:integrase